MSVLCLMLVAPPSGASPGYRLHDYSHPSWWAKLHHVAAGTATRLRATASPAVAGANVDMSQEAGPQSETSIAIDPSNPAIVVGGSNEIDRLPMRAYYSSDAGSTWAGVDLPLPPTRTNNGFDFGSDPGVAWDAHGTVYYSYIVVFFSAGGAINGSEVAVARSHDDGQTWKATYFHLASGGAKFNDKPMIAVDTDPTSPHEGTIYVAWDTTNGTGGVPSTTGILVSHSTDGGKTFSKAVFASQTHAGPRFGFAADPFVAPGGTVHIAWHDFVTNALNEAASTDGGLSFGPIHTIAPTVVPFALSIPAQASRGVIVYPACGADLSSGSHRGDLFCSWMDLNGPSGTDIFAARSTDAGVTWSDPEVVNDDRPRAGNDQFNQWLSLDPSDGRVYVSFHDTRLDPNHVSTNYFMAVSPGGGGAFGDNQRVSSASTNEAAPGADSGNQYGDYEGISAINGEVRPIWTDRRATLPGKLGEEVFTALID
jgi:hypothetical protein